MDDKERNQFVDDLLEASLSRYGSVTPRPGLEGRVLGGARAAQERRAWFLWAAWLAAGATATLMVIGVFTLSRRSTIPAPPKTVEVVKSGGLAPGLRPSQVKVPRIQQPHAPQSRRGQRAPQFISLARAEVRLRVFPSPSPMTAQEKLLAQYVRATSPEVLAASSTDSTLIPDLKIEPLEIAPLDSDEIEPKINQ